jgi:hypothetical protein
VAEFGADRVWVGVAGAPAGNIGEPVEDVEGLLPGVTGLGGVAGVPEGIAKVIVDGGLGEEVAEFPDEARGSYSYGQGQSNSG